MNQMTLGDFTKALREAPSDYPVYFDWGGAYPTVFDSYRGYYNHLALGIFVNRGSAPSAGEMAVIAQGAIGSVFVGWKGGNYVMGEKTLLWVANPGNTSDTAIVGIKDTGWCLVIQTQAEFEQ